MRSTSINVYGPFIQGQRGVATAHGSNGAQAADCRLTHVCPLLIDVCPRLCSGPMILTAISDRLGLSSLHTSSAWTVLRKYGNMSSATLIFVLRELLQQFAEGETIDTALPPGCSPFIPALAFGPGLNVEGCLLKYVGGTVGRAAEKLEE
jgi:hypothetical protein